MKKLYSICLLLALVPCGVMAPEEGLVPTVKKSRFEKIGITGHKTVESRFGRIVGKDAAGNDIIGRCFRVIPAPSVPVPAESISAEPASAPLSESTQESLASVTGVSAADEQPIEEDAAVQAPQPTEPVMACDLVTDEDVAILAGKKLLLVNPDIDTKQLGTYGVSGVAPMWRHIVIVPEAIIEEFKKYDDINFDDLFYCYQRVCTCLWMDTPGLDDATLASEGLRQMYGYVAEYKKLSPDDAWLRQEYTYREALHIKAFEDLQREAALAATHEQPTASESMSELQESEIPSSDGSDDQFALAADEDDAHVLLGAMKKLEKKRKAMSHARAVRKEKRARNNIEEQVVSPAAEDVAVLASVSSTSLSPLASQSTEPTALESMPTLGFARDVSHDSDDEASMEVDAGDLVPTVREAAAQAAPGSVTTSDGHDQPADFDRFSDAGDIDEDERGDDTGEQPISTTPMEVDPAASLDAEVVPTPTLTSVAEPAVEPVSEPIQEAVRFDTITEEAINEMAEKTLLIIHPDIDMTQLETYGVNGVEPMWRFEKVTPEAIDILQRFKSYARDRVSLIFCYKSIVAHLWKDEPVIDGTLTPGTTREITSRISEQIFSEYLDEYMRLDAGEARRRRDDWKAQEDPIIALEQQRREARRQRVIQQNMIQLAAATRASTPAPSMGIARPIAVRPQPAEPHSAMQASMPAPASFDVAAAASMVGRLDAAERARLDVAEKARREQKLVQMRPHITALQRQSAMQAPAQMLIPPAQPAAARLRVPENITSRAVAARPFTQQAAQQAIMEERIAAARRTSGAVFVSAVTQQQVNEYLGHQLLIFKSSIDRTHIQSHDLSYMLITPEIGGLLKRVGRYAHDIDELIFVFRRACSTHFMATRSINDEDVINELRSYHALSADDKARCHAHDKANIQAASAWLVQSRSGRVTS